MLDLLIKNARIVDGSNSPAYPGDVAIKAGKIAAVGSLEGAEASTTLDAAGKVVCPGFIDAHSHADLSLIGAPEGASLVQQGITTVLTGQCGISPAPIAPQYHMEAVQSLKMLMPPSVEVDWRVLGTFESFLNLFEKAPLAVNVAPLVGQGMIRAAVMGFAATRPTEEQLEQMQKLVADAMDCGAFGISTGLIYPPGLFSTTEELIEVVKPAGERGGIYFSHMRDEGPGLLNSINETIEIGRKAGARIHISHYKAMAIENWGLASKGLERVDQARAEGLDVTADMYPYTRGATYLGALLPKWASDGGMVGALKRIADPDTRQKIKASLYAGESAFAPNIRWNDILISDSANHAYEGYTVEEMGQATGKDPCDWMLEALLETKGNMVMVIQMMSEDNVRMELPHPAMMMGTDGMGLADQGPMAYGMRHPRSYGTYPRLLGQYVREEKVLSLEEAIWKSTGYPAEFLGLADRGFIRPGYQADLVVFDPQTIRDEAEFRHPNRYPSGIEAVIVNGATVVSRGKQTEARQGVVVRKGQ